MAYLKPTSTKCDHDGCASRAAVELVSLQNVNLGQFCRKHGAAQLIIQNGHEKRASR